MTEQEFYDKVHEEYGSRGVRQARDLVEKMKASKKETATDPDFMTLMMEIFLETKAEAKEKYTPKKYRKK